MSVAAHDAVGKRTESQVATTKPAISIGGRFRRLLKDLDAGAIGSGSRGRKGSGRSVVFQRAAAGGRSAEFTSLLSNDDVRFAPTAALMGHPVSSN